MTRGERFVRALPLKRDFYDRHERRAYLRAVEVAKRIVDDPGLIRNGADFLDRFMADDPHQHVYYVEWRRMLALGPEGIASRLLEDSEAGARLRDSAPAFVTIPKAALQRIWRDAAR